MNSDQQEGTFEIKEVINQNVYFMKEETHKAIIVTGKQIE